MLRARDQGMDDETDESSRPRKQRKQRPCYSCAECRRLKMKCDRQVPCSNCVRRNRVEFCIPASINADRQDSEDNFEQAKETTPPRHVQQVSSSHVVAFDQQLDLESHQSQDKPPNKHPSYLQTAHTSNLDQHSTKHSQQLPMQASPSDHDDCNPLTILAQALEPYPAQDSGLRNSTSTPSGRMATPMRTSHCEATGSSNSARRPAEDDGHSGSYGTLMLSNRGRSKYLGPTAGSEWLKESETQELPDTPMMTRVPSPELTQDLHSFKPGLLNSYTASIGFPFNASPIHISTRDLLSCLPSREEAWTLIESYYRYGAWHHDVAPRDLFEKTFDRVYERAGGHSAPPRINPQEIALVFIIMAQGTMFNIEMPNCDPSAEEWLHLSERALVKGEFLTNNTVAGLQTLHLMAHLQLQLDKGQRGDSAWPLFGLVMRLMQAMGMHRDGDRWNLPQDVAEERRKVFWECHAADIFQAHCFSRPSAMNPDHCDTAFPAESLKLSGEKSYFTLRFELSQLSSKILNMAMKVRKPVYTEVTDLDLKLCEFEQNIPFYLRCRAALLATPSRYPQIESAISASPEPSRRSLAISFQQTNLALNVSETIINLHRPYYAKAIYEVDCIESIYKASFYTVIERCAIIISIVADIHIRYPAVTTRQWNFWYHVFGSALCLGTLVLRDPSNVMASFVLTQIDAAINLFTSLLQHGAHTPRYKRNLQWLIKLRTRALSKMSEASATQRGAMQKETELGHISGNEEEDGQREENEDVELLGWRTRLIERAGQAHHKKARTIRLDSTPTDSIHAGVADVPLDESYSRGQMGIADSMIPNMSLPSVILDSTNDLLHDFWDPMFLQDVFEPIADQQNPSLINRNTWWDQGQAQG